jgi:hypothetical protein
MATMRRFASDVFVLLFLSLPVGNPLFTSKKSSSHNLPVCLERRSYAFEGIVRKVRENEPKEENAMLVASGSA